MNIDTLEKAIDILSDISNTLCDIDPKENPIELHNQLKLLNSVTTLLIEEQKRILNIAQKAILALK